MICRLSPSDCLRDGRSGVLNRGTGRNRTSQLAVDSLVSEDFQRNKVGSVTAGVVSGHRLSWTKSYGNADMEKHLRANEDSVYRIGSITKMFAAVMLEQLIESGKVRLSVSCT
jgi:CubicO group peptidase (beta-lactamase class C family)